MKRYYEEPGTERVREHFSAAERVFTSRLAYAEIHAALGRKRRERAMSEAAYRRGASAFEADWAAYDQILVDPATLAAVPGLVRRYALRGADAVHLGAALWLRDQLGDPIELWAADDRLLDVGRRVGLVVINPEGGG